MFVAKTEVQDLRNHHDECVSCYTCQNIALTRGNVRGYVRRDGFNNIVGREVSLQIVFVTVETLENQTISTYEPMKEQTRRDCYSGDRKLSPRNSNKISDVVIFKHQVSTPYTPQRKI